MSQGRHNMQTQLELNREFISDSVLKILERMTSDWDIGYAGGINAGTRLIGDLTFESIDMVQFVVAIEEQFGRRDLPFEKLLMVNGRYVEDLRVTEVIDFLQQHLNP
jgi:acyl carrier protein